MVSYKVYFYTLSIVFTFLNNQFIRSSELTENQTKKYINHLLDNLFIPQNHPITNQQHLNSFLQELTNDIVRNLGTYPHWYSKYISGKEFNDQRIYQEVINESLSFIEKCARNCTINEIQNHYDEVTGNQQKFVDKIVNQLMKELRKQVNKSSIGLEGLFGTYFGTELTTKIQNLIDKQFRKEAQRLEKLNAKTKCYICSFQFNNTNNRKIALKCGHNICLACLKILWEKMGHMIACSKCNSKINIRDYVKGIWITPTLNYNRN